MTDDDATTDAARAFAAALRHLNDVHPHTADELVQFINDAWDRMGCEWRIERRPPERQH
jgi:hypothetical protein